MKKILLLNLISLSIYSLQYTVLDETTISSSMNPRALVQLTPKQKQRIETLIQPLSYKQTNLFFGSFNRHFKKALAKRKKDTVIITLDKRQYHKPSSLISTDLDSVITTAYKHATT